MTDRHRVLLVDDNDLNRTLERTILTRSRAPIAGAVDLVEADSLAAARTELAAAPVELLLLDMQLPDGHGLDLAAELVTRKERPVIIALTASVLPAEQAAVRA